MEIIKVDKEGERLDVYLLSVMPNRTRSNIKMHIEEGRAKVNNKSVKAGYKLRIGDEISFDEKADVVMEAKPENIDINIVYEDEYLAVIDKPQGLVVHPANGNEDGTLVNALLFHLDNLSGINGVIRPGIVHRLDKDTSGLMVVAKTDEAHKNLAKQIETKVCKRQYLALLEGVVKEDEGTINANLARSKTDRKKIAVCKSGEGRVAVSHFKVEERYKNNTLMRFQLETGRTHQIRVHASYIKHPVVGDKTYGYKNQKFNLNGQLLHSCRLSFYHPVSGQLLTFESELPDYFKNVIKKLQK